MTGAPGQSAGAADALPSGGSALELFLALVRIPSPTRHEGRVAAAIGRYLDAHGVPYTVDDAAAVTGSDTGNLIARVHRSSDRPTVLLLAHLDTVQPEGSQVEPVIGEDGIVRSAGETILGADNKAAVAAVLYLLAHGRPEHANLIAVFSTCEERGRMGVTALELEDPVDYAFPVDGSDPVGTVLEAALGQVPFEIRIRGRAAHAAKAPEQGVHAVKTACDIVAELTLGWSHDALLNVSEVRGGTASNIIPAEATIIGEARAYQADALDARLAHVRGVTARLAAGSGAQAELVLMPEDGAPPFPGGGDAGENLAIVRRAAGIAGVTVVRQRIVATLEANFLHELGFPTLGIASGGRGPHSTEESLPVAELERLTALLDAVLREAASASGS